MSDGCSTDAVNLPPQMTEVGDVTNRDVEFCAEELDDARLYTHTPSVCRWLHISDLHFNAAYEQESQFEDLLMGVECRGAEAQSMEQGGMKYVLDREPIDCIILSGDVFNQGCINGTTKVKVARFLRQLYRVCSDTSKWGWNEGEPMKRLFFCPGNHDLDRNAALSGAEGGCLCRGDVLEQSSEDGFLVGDEKRKKLLTEKSFFEFNKFMNSICLSSDDDENYEYKIFKIYDKNSQKPYVFTALNTALSAGQKHIDKDKIVGEVISSAQEAVKSFLRKEERKALSFIESIVSKLRVLIKEPSNDDGKLCYISEDSNIKLKEESVFDEAKFVIAFGHHPISFFCDAAKKRCLGTLRKIGAKLYLYGHTHEPVTLNKEGGEQGFLRLCGVGGIGVCDDALEQFCFTIGALSDEEGGMNVHIKFFHHIKSQLGGIWLTSENKTTIEHGTRAPFVRAVSSLSVNRGTLGQSPQVPRDKGPIDSYKTGSEKLKSEDLTGASGKYNIKTK